MTDVQWGVALRAPVQGRCAVTIATDTSTGRAARADGGVVTEPEGYRVYVGIDWATTMHQVCVLSPERVTLASFRSAHTAEGMAQVVAHLATYGSAATVAIGIEMPRGASADRISQDASLDNQPFIRYRRHAEKMAVHSGSPCSADDVGVRIDCR